MGNFRLSKVFDKLLNRVDTNTKTDSEIKTPFKGIDISKKENGLRFCTDHSHCLFKTFFNDIELSGYKPDYLSLIRSWKVS